MIQRIKRLLGIGQRKSVIPYADVRFPMTHVHTFITGEKLYTYKPEHYTEICYRHYEQISELQRYIQAFGLTKSEWEVAIKSMRDECQRAIEPKGDRGGALVSMIKYCDHFTAKVENMKSNFEALNEFTFCMFFVLEDEAPATWSPSHNAKKLELLKAEPEVRAFFFSQLQNFSKNFQSSSAEDTAALLVTLETMKQAIQLGQPTI